MTDTKHTPEWEAVEQVHHWENGPTMVIRVQDAHTKAVIADFPQGPVKTYANFDEDMRIPRLIAAAPELLEALTTLVYCHMWEPGDNVGSSMIKDIEKARAAIAKAKGNG